MSDAPARSEADAIQAYDLVFGAFRGMQRTFEEGGWVPRYPGELSSGNPGLDFEMGSLLPGDVLRLSGARQWLTRAVLRLCIDAASVQPGSQRVLLVCPGAAPNWLGVEMFCERAGIGSRELRAWKVDEGAWDRIVDEAGDLSQLPLFFDNVSTNPASLDRRLRRLERGPFGGRERSKLVVLLGAQAAWAAAGSGESIGLALRRLARKRKAAVVWTEEGETTGVPRIPSGLLTGELRLESEDEDDRHIVVDWHRRAPP